MATAARAHQLVKRGAPSIRTVGKRSTPTTAVKALAAPYSSSFLEPRYDWRHSTIDALKSQHQAFKQRVDAARQHSTSQRTAFYKERSGICSASE